jgi:hypothetical protein
MTQLSSRIRSSFGVEIPLRTLFDKPTILEMTEAIAAKQAEQMDATAVSEWIDEIRQLSPEQISMALEEDGLERSLDS